MNIDEKWDRSSHYVDSCRFRSGYQRPVGLQSFLDSRTADKGVRVVSPVRFFLASKKSL